MFYGTTGTKACMHEVIAWVSTDLHSIICAFVLACFIKRNTSFHSFAILKWRWHFSDPSLSPGFKISGLGFVLSRAGHHQKSKHIIVFLLLIFYMLTSCSWSLIVLRDFNYVGQSDKLELILLNDFVCFNVQCCLWINRDFVIRKKNLPNVFLERTSSHIWFLFQKTKSPICCFKLHYFTQKHGII